MQVSWILRWVTLLRAVRNGYNMLNIDIDVALHDDVYKVQSHELLLLDQNARRGQRQHESSGCAMGGC